MTLLTLRCPHCGKKPHLSPSEDLFGSSRGTCDQGNENRGWVIVCCSRMEDTDLGALIKRWDKRADPATQAMPSQHTIDGDYAN